jgi:hypothetical protein
MSGKNFADKLKDSIKDTFSNLSVIDAKNDIRLVIKQDDIGKAERKSFDNCIFAKACGRQFGSTKVLLMRTVAYIALPDESGEMQIERFTIDRHGQDLIARYDEGEAIEPDASFVFKAPAPSQTLKYRREYNIKRRKARLNGELKREGEHQKMSTPREIHADVRNGTGLVHIKAKQ